MQYAVTTNNWKVSEIETYSDHKQIEFNTLPHKTTKTSKKDLRKHKKDVRKTVGSVQNQY